MKSVKPTTLQDVARDAGVSMMAVSVVLNGARSATRVSDATRARITEAASRLRYRPNAVARGLSRRRMEAIGVVAVVDSGDVNLYFLEILNGIVAAAAASGQNTTICSIEDWHANEKRILQFCDGRVDGIILLSPAELTPAFAETLRHRIPFFVIHGDAMPPGIDSVDVEDDDGSYEMVRHMIDLGHRRIAHFSGTMGRIGAGHRLAGYRRALAGAGIEFDSSLVFPGIYNTDSGRRQARTFLSAFAGRALPTAVFCASDAIATGCLEVFAQNNLRAPEEISVAGFDDLLLARMTLPPLTTVAQPFRRMGEYAVARLLNWINQSIEPVGVSNEGVLQSASSVAAAAQPVAHTEIFPCEVVVRGSVGPPPPNSIIFSAG